MQMKVSELSGAALDWAVANCESVQDLRAVHKTGKTCVYGEIAGIDFPYQPSTDLAQGGPIIDREGISWHCGNKSSWHAYGYGSAENFSGPTPLIAAMRCYVASKIGDIVEIPDELLRTI